MQFPIQMQNKILGNPMYFSVTAGWRMNNCKSLEYSPRYEDSVNWLRLTKPTAESTWFLLQESLRQEMEFSAKYISAFRRRESNHTVASIEWSRQLNAVFIEFFASISAPPAPRERSGTVGTVRQWYLHTVIDFILFYCHSSSPMQSKIGRRSWKRREEKTGNEFKQPAAVEQ